MPVYINWDFSSNFIVGKTPVFIRTDIKFYYFYKIYKFVVYNVSIICCLGKRRVITIVEACEDKGRGGPIDVAVACKERQNAIAHT